MTPELKFAVVREDFEIERALVRRARARSVLVVASGGCTALSLLATESDVDVHAFDMNAAQLAHVEEKLIAAQRGDLARLNVDDEDVDALNQRGAFEGLFRLLRLAFERFVAPRVDVEAFFAASTSAQTRARLVETWRGSRYWQAPFGVAFNEPLLHAMFGPDATRHATPGSYPAYFAERFANALVRPHAAHNPFLQHVLLGRYVASDAPAYIRTPPTRAPALLHGTFTDVRGLDRFGVVSLSNIFDWSDDETVRLWADTLIAAAKPGTIVAWRQLNNQRPFRAFFEPAFAFEDDDDKQGHVATDHSFFYERVEVGVRR
jgi:S-adenosylmethionine-diacylglycerol 3-amino-3-carboxypropyl transferase